MASMGVRGREQPSSLHRTPFKLRPHPAVWFLSYICVILLPYTMWALHWAGGDHPSLQEGASVICLHQDLQPRAVWGPCSPPQTPVSVKGLQLEPGGSRASERELQASLASCVGCFMYPGQSCCLYTHLVSHLEQLWSWVPSSRGEVGLSISLQCFTVQTGWC